MHLLRATARRALSFTPSRGIASTPRAAAAAHGHGHGHGAASHHHEDHDHHDDHHHGDPNANPSHAGYETTLNPSAGFSTPAWRRFLIAVAAAYGIMLMDRGLTKGGEETHPVGAFVERAQEKLSGLDVIRKETSEDLAIFLKRARDVAAFRQIEEKPMHRLRNASAVFEPVSRLGIPVGTQDADLSDVQVKSQYDDPDLYNPTGPVTMNPPKNLIQMPWKI